MKIKYDLLKKFPEKFTLLLKKILENKTFDGMISAEDVEELAGLINEDYIGLMLELLPFASQFSKPEVSKFKVSAFVQGESGNVYIGNNIEFAKESQTFAMHAEQGGMINAFYHMEKGIKYVVASYIPCALCRQFMNETCSADSLKIILPGRVTYNLEDLYPHSFGPQDLAIKEPLFFNKRRALKLLNNSVDNVTLKALTAAENSYAPYTENYAGVAIVLNDDRIVTGSVIENVAFVINHNPLSSALVILNIMNISFNRIKKVVLVEEKTLTTQVNQITTLLNTVAPNAEIVLEKAVNGD